MFADAAPAHENRVCKIRLVKCLYGCGQDVVWEQLKEHWLNVCDNRVVDCPMCA